MSKYFKSVLTLLICLSFLSSCSLFQKTEVAPEPIKRQEEEVVYHKVKYPRETYQIIAMWYTKSAKNVNILIAANPKVAPTRIRIGDLIRIPKELLKRPKSLPRDFVDSFYSKPEPEPELNNTDTTEVDAPTLEETAAVSETASKTKASKSDFSQTPDRSEDLGASIVDQQDLAPSENPDSSNQPESYQQTTQTEVTTQSETAQTDLDATQTGASSTSGISPEQEDENEKVREKLMKELLE